MSVEALHDDVGGEDTDFLGFSDTEVGFTWKLPVEADPARVYSLVEKDFPRFFLNADEITPSIKKWARLNGKQQGNKFFINKEDSGNVEEHILCLDDEEETPGCACLSSVGYMLPALTRESKMKALADKLGVPKEVEDTQVQETFPVIHHQTVPAPPSSPSSCDIIIEDVFEDDLEIPTECCADEQRRKLFKKETHKTGSTELVFVSHVVNPSHFYVRRYSQKKEAAILETKLENFCYNKSSYLFWSDVLKLGDKIFVKSKQTGMWCRGIITELIPLKSEDKRKYWGPMSYQVCNIAWLKIFLIDFGSFVVLSSSGYAPTERRERGTLQTTEIDDICSFVRKPDLRIEAELAAIPPLAVRCSLKDLVPKNASKGWEEEAKTRFLEMVNNTTVSMTIFREEDDVLIVDLRKPPFTKINNNMPLSLRDAFVFLDLARFRLQLPSELENHTVSQYSPPELPQEGREVFVVVCHINNPTDFYVQLRATMDSLDLSKKIQEVYKHEYKNLAIACPVEGQACIAKQEDGNWYRAQITGLPSRQEVTVKYVDFGNVATLSVKDIRRVKTEFLSLPEKAIRCRLAYIEPYQGANEWNREAKERFEEMTEDKLMVCSVVEILDNLILSVELLDPSAVHGRSCSINFQLVQEKLASYIPGYTESAAARRNEIWDASLEVIPETWEDLNHLNTIPVGGTYFKSLPEKEREGRVSRVVSPSKIFIQWLSSEAILQSLQKKMATIYKKSKPSSVKWENSMHCAVYIHALKQWQRGQISRIVSEKSAEVILYDSGAENTVDISCLRELKENIKIIEKLAVECFLADIRPTGGSNQWSITACEFLSYYLTETRVKITIQGSDTVRPLSVKIHCKKKTGEVVDIAELLIAKGLAFRNRRTNKADVTCSDSKEHLKVHLEQENTQVDGSDSQSAHARSSTAPEENIIVAESGQKSCKRYVSLLHSGIDEMYKPPAIPAVKFFQAVVSFVETDGTIYIIPKLFETEMNRLMDEIKRNFTCFDLLESYCWKKGEACLVRVSDNKWLRGKVVKLGDSAFEVQFIDRGCTKRIPPCELYPTTLYADIPPFCIPCQLYKTVPIENVWRKEAVHYLQEILLTDKEVEIQVQELPDKPWGKLSISLYFGGISLASFMAHQKYCIAEAPEDIRQLEILEGYDIVWLTYELPPLPLPGDVFPVKVTHLVSPNEVYISLDPCKLCQKPPATERDASSDTPWESLDEALKWCTENAESIPVITEFQTEMPCLAEYSDGSWYRAKLISILKSDPVEILVQFVDYGNFSVVSSSRLRQMPYEVLKYPLQAVRVRLAGIKPALNDRNVKRIPYAPEWSEEALWAMIDCVEGKQLSASVIALSPEITVYLYDDDNSLVHEKLIEMGFADLDE